MTKLLDMEGKMSMELMIKVDHVINNYRKETVKISQRLIYIDCNFTYRRSFNYSLLITTIT